MRRMFHILVVDDDKNTRRLLQAVLEKANYTVTTAGDGEEALAVMDREHIDLVVLDVMMPRMDGYEFTSLLRSTNNELPILMVTAKQLPEDKKQGFLVGTDDYMTKPIDEEEMLLRIKAEQEEKKLLLGSDYHDSGYVFCKDDGSYYRPDCIYRTFVKMLKKAGLERMRIHDLRHSAASVLFDLGWDIEKVKGWLRHRDIETTSNIYIHYNHKHIKKLTEELRGLYEI